jgi:hypothetical protein
MKGVKVEPGTVDHIKLSKDFLIASIEMYRIMIERVMGNPFNGFDAPFHDERDSRYTPILRKDDCYLPAPFRVVDAPAVRQTRQEVDEAPSYKLKQTVDKFIHEKIAMVLQ